MMNILDLIRDIPDGLSSLRYGLNWDGSVRKKGRGIRPRRCDVCHGWTRGSTRFRHFIDVNTTVTDRTRVTNRVWETCWQRHLDLEPEAQRWRHAKARRRFQENARIYRRWLEQAPRHQPATPDEEPDPPGSHRTPLQMPPRPGQEQGTARFEDLILERTQWFDGACEHWLLDIDTAAKELALHADGSPDSYIGGPVVEDVKNKPRYEHLDALGMVYDYHGYHDIYAGSVFRVDESRVLLVWKYQRSHNIND
jgi:hypothetical protein